MSATGQRRRLSGRSANSLGVPRAGGAGAAVRSTATRWRQNLTASLTFIRGKSPTFGVREGVVGIDRDSPMGSRRLSARSARRNTGASSMDKTEESVLYMDVTYTAREWKKLMGR